MRKNGDFSWKPRKFPSSHLLTQEMSKYLLFAGCCHPQSQAFKLAVEINAVVHIQQTVQWNSKKTAKGGAQAQTAKHRSTTCLTYGRCFSPHEGWIDDFCGSQSKTFEKHWDGQETSLNTQNVIMSANSSVYINLRSLKQPIRTWQLPISRCTLKSTLPLWLTVTLEEMGKSPQSPPTVPKDYLGVFLLPQGISAVATPLLRNINGLSLSSKSKLQWHTTWWIYGERHLDYESTWPPGAESSPGKTVVAGWPRYPQILLSQLATKHSPRPAELSLLHKLDK